MIFNDLIKDDKKVLDIIQKFSDENGNLLITYFNQHCFNIYKSDLIYKRTIDSTFHAYIDGFGIHLFLKILGYNNTKKYNASDLNEEIINLLKVQKKRIYLVGGNFSEDQIFVLVEKGLNVCGYQNGYFTKEEEQTVINKIKEVSPDVIFVAMGVPKQEFFASELSIRLKGKVIICVGNFFEFYLGNIKRVPKYLRNKGIEWFFRLISEPRRLWKRYIIGIPVFSYFIINELLKNKESN